MWIVFHTSHLTRRMLKIMHGPIVALFDDLLPSAGEQLPQIPADGWIPHRIFQGTASGRCPSWRDSARGIHVCVQVKRHCHPCLHEFTSLLAHCLRFLKHRHGRDAGYPTPPVQIPDVQFSRIRFLGCTRFRNPRVWEKAIPLREVGLGAPARHVRPKFPMRAASHRHPLPLVDGSPALRVLWGDPTPHGPSAALLAVGWASLWPGSHEVSQVLDASLHAYHALKWTPADPREARQHASSVSASGALKPSPSAVLPLRGCLKLWGVRSPRRSPWFPVYASPGSFGFLPPLQMQHAVRVGG